MYYTNVAQYTFTVALILQVCEGDTVKVTVRNLLISSGVSIHWQGLSMRGRSGGQGSPYMDGEPWVTQCPIMPHTEFTYNFVADPAGTHFWHAQTGEFGQTIFFFCDFVLILVYSLLNILFSHFNQINICILRLFF